MAMTFDAASGNSGSDDAGEMIGCLTYESRATSTPNEEELNALVEAARARNHALGVTGLLLYDRGRFLQTIEGPVDSLERIWTSIQHDGRHAGIEVLTQHLVGSRLFSQWDLLHYRRTEAVPETLRERLTGRHPLSHHVPQAVALALDADEAGLNRLIADLVAKDCSPAEIARDLIEPAARGLGDAWLADEASEFDVTLAMGLLQLASHAAHASTCPDTLRSSRYSILLASAPGEPHALGPTLLADQFVDTGWGVDFASPQTDLELARALREQQPDAIDIALSDAMMRPGGLARLRQTVDRMRAAVPHKPLVVSVGGRLFAEATATAEHVSADHARRSSAGTELALSELVRHRREVASKS
ncbi:MAG: BLUF domain-containing protein [Erythrobacter sp.]